MHCLIPQLCTFTVNGIITPVTKVNKYHFNGFFLSRVKLVYKVGNTRGTIFFHFWGWISQGLPGNVAMTMDTSIERPFSMFSIQSIAKRTRLPFESLIYLYNLFLQIKFLAKIGNPLDANDHVSLSPLKQQKMDVCEKSGTLPREDTRWYWLVDFRSW